MKSGLRFAAVALLFLAGLFGVCEAARAQTVIWSATLEAGSRGSDAGYHRTNGYGTLSNTNFTYKGKSFTVDSFYTITTATLGAERHARRGCGNFRQCSSTGALCRPLSASLLASTWGIACRVRIQNQQARSALQRYMKIGVNKNKELREPQRQNSSKSGLSCTNRENMSWMTRIPLPGARIRWYNEIEGASACRTRAARGTRAGPRPAGMF